jgi:hypothetical protein
MTKPPRRLTLYPHGNYREWSSKQWDDWKAELAEKYVHVSVLDDLKEWADKLAESLTAMVESYDNMPGLGAQQVLYEYERRRSRCQYCDDTGLQRVGPEPGMVDACICEAGSRQMEARYGATTSAPERSEKS